MSIRERIYVLRCCPECKGQAGESTVWHRGECPNRFRAYPLEEVLVAWPDDDRRAVEDRDALAAYLRWLTDGARGEPPMMGVDVHAMLDRIQRGQ